MITAQTLYNWNTDLETAYAARVARAAVLIAASNNAPAAQSAFATDTLQEWDSATNYSAGDYVRHNGCLFRSTADNVNIEPEEATEAANGFIPNPAWRLLCS